MEYSRIIPNPQIQFQCSDGKDSHAPMCRTNIFGRYKQVARLILFPDPDLLHMQFLDIVSNQKTGDMIMHSKNQTVVLANNLVTVVA